MRNLLLIMTLIMMLTGQAIAPRLAFAMPMSQQTTETAQMHKAHSSMKCCQGDMGCKCDMNKSHCGQSGQCSSHCNDLVSVIAPINLLPIEPSVTQEIFGSTWSNRSITVGVQTPPPNIQ